MKKLLGISLVAILAATPLMANAAPVAGEPTHADPATAATATPGFALVEANSLTDGNAASAGYVKGAYNAAIKAVNKVHNEVTSITNDALTTAGDGLQKNGHTVSVDLTENKGLQIDATSKKLEIKDGAGIKTGANGVEVDLTSNGGLETDNNGQLKVVVNNSTVGLNNSGQLEVKTKSIDTDFVKDSAMATGAGDDAVNNKLTTQGYVDEQIAEKIDDLNMGGYAKKVGVTNTISKSTIQITGDVNVSTSLTGKDSITAATTIPIMNDWANPNTATTLSGSTTVNAAGLGVGSTVQNNLGATITGAEYSEPTQG